MRHITSSPYNPQSLSERNIQNIFKKAKEDKSDSALLEQHSNPCKTTISRSFILITLKEKILRKDQIYYDEGTRPSPQLEPNAQVKVRDQLQDSHGQRYTGNIKCPDKILPMIQNVRRQRTPSAPSNSYLTELRQATSIL
ncbi:hypothetical protein LAZ67_23002412 [Cordylochernes scorpioides]|uniref:Uncharacterized protein n=1 Tax=Cordylochernes scorpioides TaxID=51811 RepID=A0ABY6LVB5_9ARAC|nr:hypothetical protein LAZ67_23002412 [Cordylochernes scorpioides]